MPKSVYEELKSINKRLDAHQDAIQQLIDINNAKAQKRKLYVLVEVANGESEIYIKDTFEDALAVASQRVLDEINGQPFLLNQIEDHQFELDDQGFLSKHPFGKFIHDKDDDYISGWFIDSNEDYEYDITLHVVDI